jgi:hypothetical protein
VAFIVEDGSGLTEANSYVSVAWADSYFASSMDRDDWDFLDLEDKQAALIQATSIIDDFWEFNGVVLRYTQALQLPRYGMPDRSGRSLIRSNEIPMAARQATAELALFLRRQRDSGVTEVASASDGDVSKVEIGPIAVTMAASSSSSGSSSSVTTAPLLMPRSVYMKLRGLGMPRYGYGSGRLVR